MWIFTLFKASKNIKWRCEVFECVKGWKLLKRLRCRWRRKRSTVAFASMCITVLWEGYSRWLSPLVAQSCCLLFCFHSVQLCFSLFCSSGRHPFKIHCLHVTHRKLFTSTFIETQSPESLQIFPLCRHFEDPQRCHREEEVSSHIWISFSFCHWLRI